MANKKTTKKNTNTSTKSSDKTKSKNNKTAEVKVQKDNANKKEITAIVIIAVCVFLFISLIGKGGALGGLFKSVFVGLFGYIGSFIVLLISLVVAICVLRGNARQVFTFKKTLILVCFCLSVTAFFHTASKASGNIESSFGREFVRLWQLDQPFAGGILAGGLSSLLIKLTTKVGAFVILVPLTLIFAMLLFKFSITPIFDGIESVAGKTKNGFESFFKRLFAKKEAKAQDEGKINIHVGDSLDAEIDKGEKISKAAEKSTENTSEKTENKPEFVTFSEPVTFVFDDIPLPGTELSDIVPEKEGEAEQNAENAENPDEILFSDGKDDAKQEEKPAEKVNETLDKAAPASSINVPILSTGEYVNYKYPPLSLLSLDMDAKKKALEASRSECDETAKKLQEALALYHIEAKVKNAYIGPSVTRYELEPKPGTRMESIRKLSDEIALCLAAQKITIEAPIPGKSLVGIEVPNKERSTVYLKEILSSDKFKTAKSKLTVSIGCDIQNAPIVCDVAKLPHLLIGGTTGSGKSVCTNGIIMSILFKASPDEVRFILIDPKMVEFAKYDGIPHLLLPVVTEPKKAATALSWAVLEMDKRYAYFAKHKVSNIDAFNAQAVANGEKTMPRIVIIIDELADLMMVAKANVEIAINRIAQKARACGMHLIIATQSPRVDVVTGLIKANIGSRIGLTVSNGTDSRIILDQTGAEKLLGRGDMIFAPITDPKTTRVQGAWVSDDEIVSVVKYICDNEKGENYIAEVIESIENNASDEGKGSEDDSKASAKSAEKEDLYNRCVELAMQEGEISISYIQRRLGIGYNRAADMMDKMVENGIIERGVGSKKSKVIKRVD